MPYNPVPVNPTGLAPNSAQYVGRVHSNEENVFDLPIQEQNKVYARYKGYIGFAHMLRMAGNVWASSNIAEGHYEMARMEDLLRVAAITTASGGAGNNMVVTLSADSMFNTGVTQGGSARQASYVQPNMVVELYDGTQAFVVSKDVTFTPHRVTLRPMLAATNLDTAILANTEYHLSTNLFGEGSGKGYMPINRTFKYRTTFGIVKTAFGVTGSNFTTKIYEEPIPGVEGSVYKRLDASCMYHHEKAIDGLLLFGQTANNIVTYDSTGLNVDVAITGVEGMIPYIKTNGTTVSNALVTYSPNSLDAIVRVAEDERSTASNVMLGLTGSRIQAARENGLQEFVSQNYAPFFQMMSLNHGGWDSDAVADTDEFKGFSYAFGLKVIQKGGITFNYKKMAIFSDIMRAGARDGATDLYGYPKETYYLPLGEKVKTNLAGEAPAMGYHYKNLDGLNRHLVINQLPGAGTQQGTVVSDKDYTETLVLSEIAPHFFCGNQYILEAGT